MSGRVPFGSDEDDTNKKEEEQEQPPPELRLVEKKRRVISNTVARQEADPIDVIVPLIETGKGVQLNTNVDPSFYASIEVAIHSGRLPIRRPSEWSRTANHWFMVEKIAPYMPAGFYDDIMEMNRQVRMLQQMFRSRNVRGTVMQLEVCVRSFLRDGFVDDAELATLSTWRMAQGRREPYRSSLLKLIQDSVVVRPVLKRLESEGKL
jgi:hypothetical protein